MSPRPSTAIVDIENILNPVKELMGYDAITWGKRDPSEIVVRVTEYVLGLTPGGIATLLVELVREWGIPEKRAATILLYTLFPLDASLKGIASTLAESPAIVKINVKGDTMWIHVHPIGEDHHVK